MNSKFAPIAATIVDKLKLDDWFGAFVSEDVVLFGHANPKKRASIVDLGTSKRRPVAANGYPIVDRDRREAFLVSETSLVLVDCETGDVRRTVERDAGRNPSGRAAGGRACTYGGIRKDYRFGVDVWQFENFDGQPVASVSTSGQVVSACLDSTGSHLAIIGLDGNVDLRKVSANASVGAASLGCRAGGGLDFDPGGQRLAVSVRIEDTNVRGKIVILDIEGKILNEIATENPVVSLRWISNDRLLVTFDPKTLALLDVTTGQASAKVELGPRPDRGFTQNYFPAIADVVGDRVITRNYCSIWSTAE